MRGIIPFAASTLAGASAVFVAAGGPVAVLAFTAVSLTAVAAWVAAGPSPDSGGDLVALLQAVFDQEGPR